MRTILLALVFLLPMLIASCTQEAQTPLVRIGHAPHDHHAPLYVAAADPQRSQAAVGFHLHEIEPRARYELYAGDELIARLVVEVSTGGLQLVRKLHERQFDIAFGGVPGMITMIDHGSPLRIIAPVMTDGSGFVVRADLPIDDWEDFLAYVRAAESPLRIGYKTDVSVQNLIFETALRHEGISFAHDALTGQADILTINMHGAAHLLPALQAGVIDGFVVNQPHVAMAQATGEVRFVADLNALPPEGMWNGQPCCALAIRDEDFLQAESEAVHALMRLFLYASRQLQENPAGQADTVASWLGVAPEIEVRSLPTLTFKTDYDEDWHRGVNFWVEALVRAGHLTGRVSEAYARDRLHEAIYAPEPLRAALAEGSES